MSERPLPTRWIHQPFLILLVVASLLAACSTTGSGDGGTGESTSGGGTAPAGPAATFADSEIVTLRVLAGSELQDMEPFFDEIATGAGVRLEPTYVGTIEGTEIILDGNEVGYDLAWFSHAKYLDLLTGDAPVVLASTPTMLSPVTVGVRPRVMEQYGWTGGDVSWADLETEATAGTFRFAMTDPASSNSGFTALVAVATALAGTGTALTDTDVGSVDLSGFFSGQALTASSSLWLAGEFAENGAELDAMVNYESVLLAQDDLTVIHPSEGLVTADYPLVLLNETQREAYDRLVAYLLDPGFQTRMSEATLRRPVVADATAAAAIPDVVYDEIPFPGTASTIDALLFSYLDSGRLPATTIYLLDVSGSMYGQPLDDLKTALKGLTGLDGSLTGKFSRFRQGETVILVPFSTTVGEATEFQIDEVSPDAPVFQQLRAYADGLSADGETALFDALIWAHGRIGALRAENPDRFYSVVVLSDGEATIGSDLPGFTASIEPGSGGTQPPTRTFPILFGEADAASMQQVADATGGLVFDSEGDLSGAFKAIRGYQ